MTQHILPNDQYNHIQDVACGCNPTIVVSEGEEMYIHREMKLTIYKTYPDFDIKIKFDNYYEI